MWFYLLNLIANLVAVIFSPVFALCIKKVPYITSVKRCNDETMIFDRYVLWDCLSWFQTFDNACDEYFWGMYGSAEKVTIAEYEQSSALRYWYRVCWLARNPAYGFAQTVLGAEPPAWQFKQPVNLAFGYYLDVNIGWKSHKGFTRLMFAGRIFALRKK